MPFAVSFDAVSNADALLRSVADDDSEAVNSNSLRRGTRVLPPISLTLTSRPTPNVGDLNSSSETSLLTAKHVKIGSFPLAGKGLEFHTTLQGSQGMTLNHVKHLY
ncbi:unnamed protein product [Sphagnum jensenii]|uniref:Uncharacterized protein n=1 Tax=Sphagnum jensenii TaxID=128206 RepID=A0ABP1BHS7_9BRYO